MEGNSVAAGHTHPGAGASKGQFMWVRDRLQDEPLRLRQVGHVLQPVLQLPSWRSLSECHE